MNSSPSDGFADAISKSHDRKASSNMPRGASVNEPPLSPEDDIQVEESFRILPAINHKLHQRAPAFHGISSASPDPERQQRLHGGMHCR